MEGQLGRGRCAVGRGLFVGFLGRLVAGSSELNVWMCECVNALIDHDGSRGKVWDYGSIRLRLSRSWYGEGLLLLDLELDLLGDGDLDRELECLLRRGLDVDLELDLELERGRYECLAP